MKIEQRECLLLIQCNQADVRLITRALTTNSRNLLGVESLNKVPDAIARIRKGGVQAIAMDIEMPKGFAGFEEVLSSSPHIPILILSGTETECIARQAVERGAHDYLLKNHMEEFRLKRVVRSMIDLKAKEDAAIQHYQPKIDLKTGEISGVEALLRWQHPTRGLVSPVQFVPIAEESGLIVPIGQWVLLEACRQTRAWLDAGLPPARMAVNVSAAEFMSKDFLSGVRAALISTGVDPHNLELELTETVLMRDAESAVKILHALKAIGVQLAVDDFGIGYSSFSYLQRFPLDGLKIDRTFINEISAAGESATILSAMIDIGLSLKHRVVAEGVETLEQLHFLQKKGCSEGQGYFFCRPVIGDEFADFLARGSRESVH